MIGLILAVFSGVLAALSFPRFGFDWLIWICLVPLLIATRRVAASPRRALILGWSMAGVGYVVAFPWVLPAIAHLQELSLLAALPFVVLFVAYHALQVGLFCVALTVFEGSRVHLLAVPCAWVLLEYLFPKVFPWSFALVLARRLPLIQVVELTGVWGPAWLVVFVNAAVARALVTQRTATRLALVAAAVTAIAGDWSYGTARMAHLAQSISEPISVTLVQANLGNVEHSRSSDDQALAIHRDLTLLALAHDTGDARRLLLWPEATLRLPLREDEAFQERLFDLAQRTSATLLVGALDRADAEHSYNSIYAISADRRIAAVYHKNHLMPFGERAPFLDGWWRTTARLTSGDSGTLLSTGSPPHRTTPEVPGEGRRTPPTPFRLGASICYEALLPGFFNEAVRDGASMLVNLTDDSWLGDTSAPWQHLDGAIFRAIETRRWLVRASNSGISAIISPTGAIISSTALFERTTLTGEARTASGLSEYVRYGDWLPFACLLFLLASYAGQWFSA